MHCRSPVNMIMYCLVLVIVAACDAQTTAPPIISEPTDSVSVNVREFGAKGDSQSDDTQAFVAALDALPATGGILRVPAGSYILTPYDSRPRRGLDLSGRTNVSIVGDGIGVTTIKLAPGDYSTGGDTHLVFIQNASGVVIRDLTLDGNLRGSTWSTQDEHRHCVLVWSPTSDLLFSRVRFYNCRGDGILLIGTLSGGPDMTERIRVENSSFEDNGRSGIAIQRGIRDLRIIGNSFARISDQSIDFEPTGAMGDVAPTDIWIENNHFQHTSASLTVTLTGVRPLDPARRIVFAHNRIENGSVLIHNADSVLFTNNVILGHPTRNALNIQRNSTNIRVVDNEIVANGGANAAVRLMKILYDAPRNIEIMGNTIHAPSGLNGIFGQDAENVRVINNEIYGQGTGSGIYFTNTELSGVPRSGFTVQGNTVKNFESAVRFNTRQDPFADVSILANSFMDDQTAVTQTIGIHFSQTGPFEGFATVGQNVFGRGIVTPILVQ